MRAAVLFEPGTPLSVEELTLDEPLAGEVRVRVRAVGVCHSDYHYMVGDLPCVLPVVLGHEGTGEVIAVGPAVERVVPRDSVILTWRPRCGNCQYCSSGRPALCRSGALATQRGGLLDGTTRLHLAGDDVHHFLAASCLAEECTVAAQSVIPIPASVPPRVAAIAGCAVITGVGAVLNVLDSPAGESVAVIGAGGVGLSAIMGAELAGADPIIAVDLDPHKLALAAELGATHTLDARGCDVVAEITRLTDGGAEWSIEAIGRPRTLEQAVECLRPGGTAVAIGLGRAGEVFNVRGNWLVQGDRQIRGSLYGSANLPVDIPRILALYESGRLPLERLIGPAYSLDDVNEAYGSLADGGPGRAIVLPNGEPDRG